MAQALQALQSDPALPEELLEVAAPIASAMGKLHRIEKAGILDPELATAALASVRETLEALQQFDASVPAVDAAMEAVAGSLSKLFALSKALEATPSNPPPQPRDKQPTVPPPPPKKGSIPPSASPASRPPPPPKYKSQPPAAQPPAAQPPAAQPPAAQPPAAQPPAAQPPAAQPPAAQPVTRTVRMDDNEAVAAAPPAGVGAFGTQALPGAQATVPQEPAAPAAFPQAHAVPAPAAPTSEPRERVPGATDAPLPPPDASMISVELGAHSESNFYKGLSGNDVIDHGGIFVATYKIPKIDAAVALRVLLPGDLEFHADAVVQWIRETRSGDSEPGFGAKLTRISAEGRQLVYRYVKNREPMFYDDL